MSIKLLLPKDNREAVEEIKVPIHVIDKDPKECRVDRRAWTLQEHKENSLHLRAMDGTEYMRDPKTGQLRRIKNKKGKKDDKRKTAR